MTSNLGLQRAQPVAHGCDSTAVEATWGGSARMEKVSAVEHFVTVTRVRTCDGATEWLFLTGDLSCARRRPAQHGRFPDGLLSHELVPRICRRVTGSGLALTWNAEITQSTWEFLTLQFCKMSQKCVKRPWESIEGRFCTMLMTVKGPLCVVCVFFVKWCLCLVSRSPHRLGPHKSKKMISDSHKRQEKRKERVKCPRFKEPQTNCALKGSSTGR